jgi:group I intron endonuclease
MEILYHYVYITTNLLNGKQYIGDHSSNNINDEYLGSGTNIRRAVKKYKKENFKREILEFFDTKQKAFNAQEKYINEYNTLIPNGYNISPKGGYIVHLETIQYEDTKKKQSNALKGIPKSKEHKQRIADSKMGEKNPMYGKHMSEKTKQQIIKSNRSRICEKNPMYGKKHTEETKQKISNSHKGNNHSDVHKQHISDSLKGRFYITNGIVTKQLKRGESVPENWKLGRK